MNQNNEACLCSSMRCAYNMDEPAQKMKTSPNSQNQWAGDPPKNGQSSSENGNQTGSKHASGVSINKDLFNEHIQVLRNELPQFQSFLKRNKIQTKKFPNSKSGSNQPQTNSSDRSGVQLNICKDISSGSEEVVEQKDKLPQNLRKFMNKLMKLVQKDSVQSLQLMGELIWSRYQGVREKVFEVYQLLNYSQQILDSLELEFEDRLMNRHIQAEDKDYLTNFLQIYTATLLLVLNQYFQNPYYEQTAARYKEEKEDSSNRSGKEDEKQSPRKIVHQDIQGSESH